MRRSLETADNARDTGSSVANIVEAIAGRNTLVVYANYAAPARRCFAPRNALSASPTYVSRGRAGSSACAGNSR